jgi:hypothetical protein
MIETLEQTQAEEEAAAPATLIDEITIYSALDSTTARLITEMKANPVERDLLDETHPAPILTASNSLSKKRPLPQTAESELKHVDKKARFC